jgi:putative restriction endonuclease
VDFDFQFQNLPERHQLGLRWFENNRGLIQNFPSALDQGQLLATKAKGIYKPADSDYALSIRIMLGSPYSDGEFYPLDADGWVCAYHQENNARDIPNSHELFTNRGLQFCLIDKVPVGILKQTQSENEGGSRYKVIGLGGVVAKIGSYFILTDIGTARTVDVSRVVEELLRNEAENSIAQLDPESETDSGSDTEDDYREKIKVWAQIVRRQGQGKFRKHLLRAYEGRCCITGTTEEAVLDAAHIIAYNGPSTNNITNGLLLRTDLHALFDLNLLGIEPGTNRIRIHKSITDPYYRSLEMTQIRNPILETEIPSYSNLLKKWENFELFAKA